MKRYLSLLGFMLVSSLVQAQSSGYYGGFGFFDFGMANYNLSPINNLLQANGYSGLGSNFITTGGSGFALFNNIVIGGAGGSLGMQSFSRPGATGRYNAGFGQFSLGYAFKTGEKSFFYPMLGLGGMQTNIQIEDDNTSGSVNNSFATPNQVVNMNSSNGILDFSLNYIFRVGGGGNAQGAGGPAIGISAGGFWSPGNTSFKMNEKAMSDVPAFQPSGFYFRLKFGGGGYGIN
jgi:hypothetical protein